MCIALAMAFAYKYQCFNIFFPKRLGHIRPFKGMAMTSLHLANLPTKFIFLFILLTKVYRPIWS